MTTANQITLSRILLVPVFMVFLFIDATWANWAALVVFVVASGTDWLDGYIARKYNQITNFGKFVDPIADKLLVTAALVSFVQLGHIAVWMVVVIIARDLIVDSMRMVAVSGGKVIAANIWGKMKTIVQIAAIVALLVYRVVPYPAGPLYYTVYTKDLIYSLVYTPLIWAAVILTIFSGIVYLWQNREVIDSI